MKESVLDRDSNMENKKKQDMPSVSILKKELKRERYRRRFRRLLRSTVNALIVVAAVAALIALILTEGYVTLPIWAAVKGLFA